MSMFVHLVGLILTAWYSFPLCTFEMNFDTWSYALNVDVDLSMSHFSVQVSYVSLVEFALGIFDRRSKLAYFWWVFGKSLSNKLHLVTDGHSSDHFIANKSNSKFLGVTSKYKT